MTVYAWQFVVDHWLLIGSDIPLGDLDGRLEWQIGRGEGGNYLCIKKIENYRKVRTVNYLTSSQLCLEMEIVDVELWKHWKSTCICCNLQSTSKVRLPAVAFFRCEKYNFLHLHQIYHLNHMAFKIWNPYFKKSILNGARIPFFLQNFDLARLESSSSALPYKNFWMHLWSNNGSKNEQLDNFFKHIPHISKQSKIWWREKGRLENHVGRVAIHYLLQTPKN